MPENDFNAQFSRSRQYFLNKMDFLDWYRYYFIIREVIDFKPKHILEIGAGSGLVKNFLQTLVEQYTVMDVNRKLNPDILADIREEKTELIQKFDCVIAADVLEHVPFADVENCVSHLHAYLRTGGKALVTIPHRRSHFLFMTPSNKPYVVTVPTGFLTPGSFYRRFIRRKIWIDPDHCWEIGDGKIKKNDIEKLFKKAGFAIEKSRKLLYVDFWVLQKANRAR